LNSEKQKSQVIRNGNLRFLLLQIIFFCRVLDIRVAQIVKTSFRHTDIFCELLEFKVYRLRTEITTMFFREYKVEGVMP